MDSTDHETTTRHRRLRAVIRWLPGAIAGFVLIAAIGAMAQLGDVANASSAELAGSLETPILSLRRDVEPLRQAAADRALRTGLDGFVASQPPDTCLRVRIGDFVYDHRTDDPQVPASLQKLLTGVAVLEALDAEHPFTTEVLVTTPPDDGVVGDLFLRGGGDPLLATGAYMARERNQPQVFTDIERLADELVAAGVREVTGTVVGDEGRYDTVRYNPAWPARFVAQSQAGPLSALSVNDGFDYFPERNGVFGASADPAAYAAEVLARALRERGVVVSDTPVRSGPTPPGAVPLAAIDSAPLGDVVAQMLRESDNNTAELLVKELGYQMSGAGTTEAGAQAVSATLTSAGLDLSSASVLDGSGLAPGDIVTCALISDLLDHDPTEDAIEAALPVAGESGTLARRFTRPEVAGRVRAKTGTLNQVTALAGIADTAGTHDARFSLVVNVPDTERIAIEMIAAQERLAELLVAYPKLPDVDAFRPG